MDFNINISKLMELKRLKDQNSNFHNNIEMSDEEYNNWINRYPELSAQLDEISKKHKFEQKVLLIGAVIVLGLFFLRIPAIVKIIGVIILVIASIIWFKKTGKIMEKELSESETNNPRVLIKTIAKQILEEKFDNLEFETDYHMSRKELFDTFPFFYKFDYVKTEDYVSFEYNGMQFAQLDIEGYDRQRNDSTTENNYKGRIIEIESKRKIDGQVLIKDKHQEISKIKGLKAIKTEDEEFNSMFKCYTDSPQDTFYVLTPRMIENIKQFKSKCLGSVVFYFSDDTIIISIDDKRNTFSVNALFKNVSKKQILSEIIYDTNIISDTAEDLKIFKDYDLKESGI